ncbi:MAG: YraN family protein [Methylocystis sp.]
MSRSESLEFGAHAETVAEVLLRLKFYKILARRYRVKGGEIDIVARRGDVVAFVEVKARAEMDAALIAITPQKERRLRIAAERWLVQNPWAVNCTLRADAVFVAPRRLPQHVEDVMVLGVG